MYNVSRPSSEHNMKVDREKSSAQTPAKREKRKLGRDATERQPTFLPQGSATGWQPVIDALAVLARCELPPASELACMPPAQADIISEQYVDLGVSMLRVLGSAFEVHQLIERAQLTPAESAVGARWSPFRDPSASRLLSALSLAS